MDEPYIIIEVAQFLGMTPPDLEGQPYWLARGLELMEAKAWAEARYNRARKRRKP